MLITNTNLFRIGYISKEKYSFYESEPETFHNSFFIGALCISFGEIWNIFHFY